VTALNPATGGPRSASVFLPRSEFDAFLFAPVGTDANGMTLSVLSMLARTGVDPWGEAADLARLPGAKAIDTLISLIAELPDHVFAQIDRPTIAARIAALLPRRAIPDLVPSQTTLDKGGASAVAISLVVMALLMVGGWMLANRQQLAMDGKTQLQAPTAVSAGMPPSSGLLSQQASATGRK
jgi:hypothetical protein